MAITFVSGQGNTINGTSANVNTAGLQINDICFVMIAKQSANSGVGLPAGWTALLDNGNKLINTFIKPMLVAGDLTATNTFTFPNGRGAFIAVAFRGGRPGSILSTYQGAFSGATHQSQVDWPALTGVPAGSIFIGVDNVFDTSGNFFGSTAPLPAGYNDSGVGDLGYGLGTPNDVRVFYALNVSGTVDPPTTTIVGTGSDFGYNAASFSFVLDVAPTCTVTGPTGGAIPAQPTVTWTYSDTESEPQAFYDVKIFTAAQYGIGGFDPEVSPNTWDSGVVAGSGTSQLVGTPLAQGTYRAYVKVSDGIAGFGAWSFLGFTEPFNGFVTMTGTGDQAAVGVATAAASASLPSFGDLAAQPTVVAAAAARKTIGSKSPVLDDTAGRLGCGTAGAFISGQCGYPTICVLDGISEIEWERRLDDVSEALVHISLSGDANASCCECLSEVEPWCHELHITRNGVEQWCGPITQVIYSYGEVIIKAIDMVGWLGVKVPAINSNFAVLTNLTDIAFGHANSILNIAFNETNPCLLTGLNVQTYANDVTGLAANAAYSATSLEHLNDLAHVGLNYTTLGRSIILSGQIAQLSPLVILRDEHILGDVELTKDGLLAGTRYYVHYQGDLGIPSVSPSGPMTPANSYCYGAIERMRTENNTTSVAQAQALAAAYVAATKIAPRSLVIPSGSRLHPDTPWTIQDMVCGARVDVQISNLCFPIQQSFILTQMKLTENPENGEQVLITLNPISTVGVGT